jgi:hypothetical protein
VESNLLDKFSGTNNIILEDKERERGGYMKNIYNTYCERGAGAGNCIGTIE